MSDVTDRAATEVQAWLEPRADEMAALLCELVAIDTENPPGRQLGRCGRLLRDDECVEVTPGAVRLRKVELDKTARTKLARRSRAEAAVT